MFLARVFIFDRVFLRSGNTLIPLSLRSRRIRRRGGTLRCPHRGSRDKGVVQFARIPARERSNGSPEVLHRAPRAQVLPRQRISTSESSRCLAPIRKRKTALLDHARERRAMGGHARRHSTLCGTAARGEDRCERIENRSSPLHCSTCRKTSECDACAICDPVIS